MNKLTKQIRNNDGFIYETTKQEAEEYFYGDVADVLGQPMPNGMWEAIFLAPILDENDRKEYLSNHCYSPLVRQLIKECFKESGKNE